MLAGTGSRILFSTALGAWALAAAGCVHALGPGYHFPDRQAEIRVSGGLPGRLHIRVVDELENAGDRPLESLEVRLPEGSVLGAQNLRVQIEGAEVTPQHSSPTDPRMMRTPFNPTWQQNERRRVVTEWDLSPETSSRGTIVVSPNGFYIADETAFPLWQTPVGVFPRGGTKPATQLVTVYAPPDFRILAPGKPLKRTIDRDQVVQRFLTTAGSEFFTYVVAGRYQEKIIPTRQGDVQFWTLGPIDAPAAQTAAARFSASMKALTEFFGPASKEALGGNVAVRIAEAPQELPDEFGPPGDSGGASFPQGALLDPKAFAQGLADENVLQLVEYELARTWFGWRVRPRPEAQILMGRGVALFAMVVIAESRGPAERRRYIASLLAHYDEARAVALDGRLMEPPTGYARAQRISTGYRAALFLVALEDLCGRDSLKTALRDIIGSREASDTGYEELRAALESESGKDLAEMFRVWLVQPGIPDDFRNRYK